ncbi:hypothetical protein EDF60_1698 [Leucobacter luti]|uniref:hypothetical protein n=1 Tax=Leucobacter luti TaxID=340320 RepID=UPI00104991BB|nr:hypothetical protein [Leucobacter luti]MCW2287047.1 hypothetical protein [Leucobacter luti]TCK41272.1 hypothetical protein EDF60_1698 [Leucobacter luti]
MISLGRKRELRDQASSELRTAKRTAAVGRTGQVVRSSVAIGDDDVSLDAVLVGAVEESFAGESRDSDISFLDESDIDSFDVVIDAGGAADIDMALDAQEGDPDLGDEWEAAADADEDAHQADMSAIEAQIGVDVALQAAEEVAESALKAQQTADGRNRIYAQAINPVASPEFPFVNGDLWYRTEVVGGKTRFVEVFMWNGAVWSAYQMVASSLLVPGSIGPVLIENGAITGQKLAFDAIDGKTITGALIRTAPTGQRLELGAYGLVAYDDTNYPVASISSAGGNMMMTGSLWTRDPNNTTGLVGGGVLSPTGVMARDYKTSNDVSIDTLNGFEHYVAQTATAPTRSGRMEADHINLATYQRNGSAVGPHTGSAVIVTGNGGELELRTLRGASERRFVVTPGQTSGYTIFTDGAMPLVELRRDHVYFAKDVSYASDTGWFDIPLQAGFSFGTNGFARGRMKNQQLYVVIQQVQRSSGTGQANMIDFSQWCVPGSDIPVLVWDAAGATSAVNVTSAGTLRANWLNGTLYRANLPPMPI